MLKMLILMMNIAIEETRTCSNGSIIPKAMRFFTRSEVIALAFIIKSRAISHLHESTEEKIFSNVFP